jgi:hypothetical protein
MQNQTVNLNAKTNAGSASIPNVLSRILLAAEVVVIIFPLLALASILTFFFVIFWIPMAIGSSIFDRAKRCRFNCLPSQRNSALS